MILTRLAGIFASGCLAAACAGDWTADGFQPREGNGGLTLMARLAPTDRNGFEEPEAPRSEPLGQPALLSAELAGGAVTVAGPDGYCIDPSTLQRNGARGFAVIASCRILSGGRGGPRVEPALITVSVGGEADMSDLPSPNRLAEITGSSLIEGGRDADMVLANLAEGGKALLEEGDDRYWRAMFLQNGRLVALALYAQDGSDLAGPGGARMLARARDAIAARSGSEEVDEAALSAN